jgi:hypothetical protein
MERAMIYYFINFPSNWSLKPRFFKTLSEIKNTVRDYICSLEIDPVELDKLREKEADRLYEKLQERVDKKKEEYIPRNDFNYKYQLQIEDSAKKKLSKKLFNDHYRKIGYLIEKFAIRTSNRNDLVRLEKLAKKYGVPESAFAEALETRKAILAWGSEATQYYKSAHVTNSVFWGSPGTKKLVERYSTLVRLRYYKNGDGSTRKTVEIEIGT